jgi:ubiquinone/menaquinone biosynthesis C-methylase UbiE
MSTAEELAGRLSQALNGTYDLMSMYVGHQLGLYAELAAGARTPPALAAALGLNERYVREWLEHQAATGFLEVADPDVAPEERLFALPDGYRAILLDPDDPRYAAPYGPLLVGLFEALPDVLEAFRTGGGVPFARYGKAIRETLSMMGRATYPNVVGTAWLPAIPDLHARLLERPGARVADIACGVGWSTIAIARAYPDVTVDGLDLDTESIREAEENRTSSDVADRVTFAVRDAADPALSGAYDLVTVFEALHDMSDPVGVLRSLRGLLAPEGSVLVADGKAPERFTAPSDEGDRNRYGSSVFHCLPVGMASQPSAATGAQMRPQTVRAYAEEAGFSRFEVPELDDKWSRLYRLRV